MTSEGEIEAAKVVVFESAHPVIGQLSLHRLDLPFFSKVLLNIAFECPQPLNPVTGVRDNPSGELFPASVILKGPGAGTCIEKLVQRSMKLKL